MYIAKLWGFEEFFKVCLTLSGLVKFCILSFSKARAHETSRVFQMDLYSIYSRNFTLCVCIVSRKWQDLWDFEEFLNVWSTFSDLGKFGTSCFFEARAEEITQVFPMALYSVCSRNVFFWVG